MLAAARRIAKRRALSSAVAAQQADHVTTAGSTPRFRAGTSVVIDGAALDQHVGAGLEGYLADVPGGGVAARVPGLWSRSKTRVGRTSRWRRRSFWISASVEAQSLMAQVS